MGFPSFFNNIQFSISTVGRRDLSPLWTEGDKWGSGRYLLAGEVEGWGVTDKRVGKKWRGNCISLGKRREPHLIASVGPYTIVCLYSVLGRVSFVSRYSVAFAIIGEIIISDSPPDLAGCPKAMAVPLGSALWHTRAHLARDSKGRLLSRTASPSQDSAMPVGIALCPTCWYLAEDGRGRVLSCTDVDAYWQP